MSIELPGPLVDVFNFIGLPWPGVDEDQLRAWGGDLRGFAEEITAISRMSHTAVTATASASESAFLQTAARQWDHHHGLIMAMRAPMDGFADALDVAADAVEVQKGAVLAAAGALAAEVIATQGEALVTFGLAEGELPLEVAATKMAVKFALQELENRLISLLINKAADEISAHISKTVSNMLMGALEVVTEVQALKTSVTGIRELAATINSHADRTERSSTEAQRRSSNRKLETDSAGGRWHVAEVLEAALVSLAQDIFRALPGALFTVLKTTGVDLSKAADAIESADRQLARDAAALDHGASGGPHPSGAEAGSTGEDARGADAGGPDGTGIPSQQDVVNAVRASNPQISDRTYTSEDGHYYATRVLAGGRADGETVFAGHGWLERGAGTTTVPPGTTISFYVHDGELLPGMHGVAVEGGVYPGQAVQTFHGGDEIPNYTLAPPGGNFTVYENSTTVPGRTSLSDLLKPGMGQVHWAACREFKS